MLVSALSRWFASTKRWPQTPARGKKPRHIVLRLEALEDRTVPSTITVMNNADNGSGSLRAAIAAANSGDTINFANSLHGQTIVLATELTINKSLNIQGLGADRLTVSGNNLTRVFDLTAGTTTIANLTIAHGNSTGLVIPGMGGGGGIYNQAGATLTLNNDVVSNNEAVGTVGYSYLGGGLLNLGTATVTSCVFTNNQVVGAGSGDSIGGSAGGAIGNTTGGTLVVTNSTLGNNTCLAAGGGLYYFALGGALENDSGVNGYDPTQAQAATATLTNCSVFNNLVTGGEVVLGNGGSINNEGIGTTCNLVDCSFTGNRSVGGGGGDGITTGNSDASGGALMNDFLSTMNVVGCTIANNLVLGGNNSVISAASPFASSGIGGGIENNSDGTLNISNSVIADNIAQGGAMTTLPGPGGFAAGGGISNSPNSPMNMSNCLVIGNSAIGGHGNAGTNTMLAPGQLAGFGFGGGIDISNTGSVATISNSVIYDNQAIGGAGGAGNTGGNGYGGGIGVGWAVLVGISPDGSQLTLTGSLVDGNEAEGAAAGSGATGGNGYGGGLFVGATSSATVSASAFLLNDAEGGPNGHGYGGGVAYEVGSTFNASSNTVILFNHASTSGNDILQVP